VGGARLREAAEKLAVHKGKALERSDWRQNVDRPRAQRGMRCESKMRQTPRGGLAAIGLDEG
jgi:hypothetical protein